MANELSAPPVLSTPDTHVFEDPSPTLIPVPSTKLSKEELYHVYEIPRTVKEIQEGGWRRIALQFPDHMLHDAPRVFEALETELFATESSTAKVDDVTKDLQEIDIAAQNRPQDPRRKLCILADTSYGACCVDEIAAEHTDAEVVVHYGRSCLSPTARLPVIYVFTTHPLDIDVAVEAFQDTFPEKNTKVILMADITYSDHTSPISQRLTAAGYTNIFTPSILHDPSSPLPNRTLPPSVIANPDDLKSYHLFHISTPPTALLLTLSSRLASLYIYPTSPTASAPAPSKALLTQTTALLRRRYALLTSLSTCAIFGILVNTLSVKNYLPVIDTLRSLISASGKKSYTFVVGKVNSAKIANFAEIGGWVVVGCWESSLLEAKDFWKPVITPFELQLALQGDAERVWTGEWEADFNSIGKGKVGDEGEKGEEVSEEAEEDGGIGDDDSEEESAPPEFDLRTGRYISHTRPMQSSAKQSAKRNTPAFATGDENLYADQATAPKPSNSLITRAKAELATVNGVVSPGAEYLRSQRTWTGLGSDFTAENAETEGALVEEGRSGVARGYVVGDREGERH